MKVHSVLEISAFQSEPRGRLRWRETPLTNLSPGHHQSCDTWDEIKLLGCHQWASSHLHDNSK